MKCFMRLEILEFNLFIGVETSTEDIEVAVNEIFEQKKSIIVEQRYRTNGLFFFISPSNIYLVLLLFFTCNRNDPSAC